MPICHDDTVLVCGYWHGTKAIKLGAGEGDAELLWEEEEAIRVEELVPQPDGWVEVTYQVRGDPGGWVPVWMANYAAVTSVIRTLENMVVAVERYRDARSPHVQELDATANR